MGSFDWKLEWLVTFLIVESDWKATNTPSTSTVYPNTSNQKFEIAILFNAIEYSGNYICEHFPHSLQGKGYKLSPGGIYGS